MKSVEMTGIFGAVNLMPVVLRDLNGTIRAWSAGNTRLFGWTEAEALGCPAYSLLQTRTPVSPKTIEAELRQNGFWLGELQHKAKNGRLISVRSQCILQQSEDGMPIVVEISYDLSSYQSKKFEQLPAHSTTGELQAIYQSGAVGLAYFDLEGRYIRINPELARIHGLSAEEHIRKTPAEVNGRLGASLTVNLQKVLQTGKPLLNVEYGSGLLAAYNTRRAFRAGYWPVQSPEFAGISLVVQDFTPRSEVENLQRHLSAIVESSDDAIISKSLDGRIMSWNRGATRVFGYTADEVLGKSIDILAAPTTRYEFKDILARISRGERIDHYETIRKHKDGRLINVSLTVSPILGSNGQIIGASKTARDITERKKSEADLLHVNEELRQFAYAAAHDLQEPARTVGLYSQILLSRYAKFLDDKATDLLKVLTSSAEHMQMLVRDLLSYTQAVDATRVHSGPVDCNEVLSLVLANLESSLRNAEPDIVIGDLPTLEGYAAVHLIQIFQNLLSNALKYRSTDQKCRIEINAKRIDDMWQFSIYDNGIGIDKRYQERIFGLFKRLHGREYEGTGIGLAICRRVINFYKGNIWVDSEPGAGTTFYVELPIRTPPG